MSAQQIFVIAIAASTIFAARLSNAQPRRVPSTVYATFERKGEDTELIGLAVTEVSPGTKIVITCSGSETCHFSSREMNIDSRIATLGITDMFEDTIFKPGTTIGVRITKAGSIGKVFQYDIMKNADPRETKLCLPPGAEKPVAC